MIDDAALHAEPSAELTGASADPSRLRAWRESDREPFASMNANPEVMRFFPSLRSRDESDAFVDRIIAQHRADSWGLWALEVEGRFAGYVGLARAMFPAPFTPAFEIGWRLDSWAWGRGAASTAARRVLAAAHGFGIDEVLSFTAELNLPSIAVMTRIGMTRDREGDFAHPNIPDGHPLRPHVLYRWAPAQWICASRR
ncbi:RimJ/RimL family protein N-acetyltransferase [Microcella alkaliphila]|uniref:RimJ/RimL family protein N-acetyltransferase n=1 Tax=Microcella alkaliphila TaxID=279828 RepID=A0A4Q7TJQ9_9MICO|nr:GNAT family N-acetyltransferase [Microcella alkaliphila]RZT60865.1 RimJ/RimL family protein N-acetyltransferase [Microcella alkaliphila]